jgi:hypothetical protein
MASIVRRLNEVISSGLMFSSNTPLQDVELAASPQQGVANKPRPLRGFPSLAAFMSENSYSESFIFQRFDRLAARNLIYMQSELAELQKKMDDLDRQDNQPPFDLEARKCARSWEDFERIKDHNSKQQERWDLMIKIKEKLREYRK